MGGDQFAELETWKDCDELARLCNVVVHTRQVDNTGASAHPALAVLNRFGYAQSEDHYVHPSGHCLSFVQTTFLPISATLIRGIFTGESQFAICCPPMLPIISSSITFIEHSWIR